MATMYKRPVWWTIVFLVVTMTGGVAGEHCTGENAVEFLNLLADYFYQHFHLGQAQDFDEYEAGINYTFDRLGWYGGAFICTHIHDLFEVVKKYEDCADAVYLAMAKAVDEETGAKFFYNLKHWKEACGDVSYYNSSFACIEQTPDPVNCTNAEVSCFDFKQSSLCVQEYYREHCGDIAAEFMCQVLKARKYGDFCMYAPFCSEKSQLHTQNFLENSVGYFHRGCGILSLVVFIQVWLIIAQ